MCEHIVVTKGGGVVVSFLSTKRFSWEQKSTHSVTE